MTYQSIHVRRRGLKFGHVNRRQFSTTRKQHIVALFAATIEEQDRKLNMLSSLFHKDVLGMTSALRMYLQLREIQTRGTPNELCFEEELKMLDKLSEDARSIYKVLYPTVLRQLGLFHAFNECIWSYRDSHPTTKLSLNNVCSEGKLFSDESELHVYRVFSLTLNYLLIQPTSAITVDIYEKKNKLHLDFCRETTNKASNSKIIHEMELKRIQANLMLVDGIVSESTNWSNQVKLAVPY